MKQVRGGVVLKAHRRVYHSTLGSRVINSTLERDEEAEEESGLRDNTPGNISHYVDFPGEAHTLFQLLSSPLPHP